MHSVKYNLIVITGPTASGKTAFAAHLASVLNGEILSGDSRQIYRRMDLGTGKDYQDYFVNGKQIPAHLIDIKEPGYKYNVYEFQNDFFKIFKQLTEQNKTAILCGGTGLYIEAVLKGYKMIHVPPNPELRKSLEKKSLQELETILSRFRKLHNSTDTDTVKRAIRAIEIENYYQTHPDLEITLPEIRPLIIGVSIDREERRKKITQRLNQRLNEGMVEEVKHLLDEGIPPENLIYYGLEYKFITQYIIGQLSYEEMVRQLNIAIHQFAKRQMTWFRGMERRGFNIQWIESSQPMKKKTNTVIKLLND
jgi:tRNA dimethylallyltransferase